MNNLIPSQKNPQPNHKAARKVSLTRTHVERFVGPLPPPEILIKYEQAFRGAADRIIAMAENQSKHRQKLENKVISSNVANERISMILSFVLTIIFMIIGAILIFYNKQIVVGYLSLFAPTVFHGGNYIYRKYMEKEELKEKEIENAKKNNTTKSSASQKIPNTG